MEDGGIIYRGVEARDVPLGASAEAVDVCCDRLFSLLPVYVPRVTSILVGAIVAALAMLALAPFVRSAYEHGKTATSPTEQMAWVFYAAVTLVLGMVLYRVVSDTHYRFRMVAVNPQHFALVHWVAEYARAARKGWTL